MGNLQTSVDALIGVSTKQNCRIAKIKKLQEDADFFGSSSDSSYDEHDTIPKSSALHFPAGS